MRKRVRFQFTEKSMTQQHFKQECDANSIIEKFRKTGMPPTHVNQAQPVSGDFTSYQDFKTNLDLVMNANDQFMSLPAHVRKRFGNDPSQLVEFVMNSDNREEAIKLGLVEKPVAPIEAQNDDQTTNNPPQNPAT